MLMTPALSKRKKYYMEQSILRTLAYFDLADYPLTKEELFSYLWQSPAVSYGVF